jgi:divalent metal cation (Fe/Co/Zn/Cd) transporter
MIEKGNGPSGPTVHVERWGWASIAVNVGLSTLNLGVLWLSGSLAVAAELVHNVVDLSASVAVLVGLKLPRRKSEYFPYGMYKVENVVAAGVATLIFFAAYEMAREVLLGRNELPRRHGTHTHTICVNTRNDWRR